MVDLTNEAKQFLVQLYQKASGNTASTVSMFDVGASLGMERENAAAMAEEVIGWGLVEVRTLSGGIAITQEGLDQAMELGAAPAGATAARVKLGTEPVLGQKVRDAVEQVAAGIKSAASGAGLDFEALSELVADVKTVDAQLASPRPKTAVIRECLRSILGVLQKGGDPENLKRVKELIGN